MSWGNTFKTALKCIVTTQNKYLRSIFFLDKKENTNSYYKLLSLLKLEKILHFKIATFTKTLLYTDLRVPEVFVDVLKPLSNVHSYNTRLASSQNLFKPSVRTSYGQFTFSFLSCQVWQSIPFEIKQLPFTSFKKKLKQYFINYQ